MKKYFLLINIIFLFTILDTKALTSSEIEKRSVCENIELAIANKDKSLTSVKCFDNYSLAKEEMTNLDNDNLVILERKNNNTKIIDAKMALVYLGVRSVSENTNYYSDSNLKTSISYMNHHSNYGATDGVFLELNYSNYAIKIKSNGVVGWIKDGYYKIIPLNFLGNHSYYQITNNGLYHYYSKNIETSYSQFSRIIDNKPSFLNIGKYYSQDGIYFYNNVSDMIKDYKNNTYQNSVNYDNPYYNYYMYLPHRAKTNYTSDDIDLYLKNTKGLIGTIYGKKLVSKYSNMYQTGIFFKSSESLYGANAILMMSLAVNESSLGQSSISINKNNLFGHAAYDSDAYNSATGYLNPYQSIIGHANSYINCGYANPKDYRYRGSNMGNKTSGMNISYASDPYWGEKAANYYYLFDKDNGFLDYNYYQLGITTSYGFNVRSEPNMTSSILYTISYMNVPVIILDEVEGVNYNGSNKWYKIVSDANLNNDRNSIKGCSYTNYYNWNSFVYVHSSFIKKINTSYNNKYNSNNLEDLKDYTYKEYSNGANYNPKVGLITNDTKIYLTSTMSISTNTIKKGHLATVFMEAIDKDNKVIAYLITTDYSKNQKGWVSSDSLSFSDKDILKVNLINSGDYLNVFTKPGGEVLGSIYTDTYSVIVDKQIYNKDTWLKIHYNTNNTYAWINTNIDSSKGNLTYTLDKLNQVPVINASDKKLYKFEDFNPKDNVKAYDNEDGDLTKNISITFNDVDVKQEGIYHITYEVSDSKGEKCTKTIKVEVLPLKEGNSLFIYESLKYVNDNNFSFSGFLGIKKQDNVNINHSLLFINEETNETIEFKMESYKDYPYEMSSLDDDKVYNYSGGWFKGVVSLDKEKIKEGNYTIFIVAYNYDTGYYTSTYFTNIAYLDMERRVKTNNRGFSFDVDYSYSGSPILMTIRDKDLLSYEMPTTFDPMYNFFNEITLKDDKLEIIGTSHSVNIGYSKNDVVERNIIFENKDNYLRYTYNLGYIDNGPYKVELGVSDGKDKTRSWYKNIIDLSTLPKGNYVIYIKTTSNNITYYGELIDIAYTDFSSINTYKYKFLRSDKKRLRLELQVS